VPAAPVHLSNRQSGIHILIFVDDSNLKV